MMKIFGAILAFCLVMAGYAQETVSTTTTTTVTTTTTTTVKKPFIKVAVMDFMTTDKIGADVLSKMRVAESEGMKALDESDRKSINGVMQGFVKLLEASQNASEREDKWLVQKELFNKVLNGAARPAVLGADYLSAYLGRHGDVFGCKDSALLKKAMLKLQSEPDFPKDFTKKLAAMTDTTHVIYCSVSDIRTRENSFKGYGIETKTTLCQLDVIVKMVDLAEGHTVFSNVYTGSYKEQRPISVEQFDNNIFQNLMTSALEQAAEELYDLCKPLKKKIFDGEQD